LNNFRLVADHDVISRMVSEDTINDRIKNFEIALSKLKNIV